MNVDIMGELSARLQRILAAAGLGRGEGIRLVTRLAKAKGLRDWANTRDEADYEALIGAVETHIANATAHGGDGRSLP